MTHWSADVEHGADPAPTGPRPDDRAVPDRPPSRAQRRAETAHLLTVLSEALATQVDRLVASTDPAPDGWWFDADRTTADPTTEDLRIEDPDGERQDAAARFSATRRR